MYKSKNFQIQELVSPDVYNRYGETAWQFFDERLLKTLDDLRKFFNKPMIINDWLWGGQFKQRGLRANMDDMVLDKTKRGMLYCSQHCFGRGVDFDVKGMTAEQVRQDIMKNQDKFPYIKRMEANVNWVHIDLANIDNNGIYMFKA